MGIWIMSQDKKSLVETNAITIKAHQVYDKKTYHIESTFPVATLGVYRTEEKAKEVLDMLANVTYKSKFVVDMPEE